MFNSVVICISLLAWGGVLDMMISMIVVCGCWYFGFGSILGYLFVFEFWCLWDAVAGLVWVCLLVNWTM